MDEARSRDAWDHTAGIIAAVINVQRAKAGAEPLEATAFHPYYAAREVPMDLDRKQSMKALARWAGVERNN